MRNITVSCKYRIENKEDYIKTGCSYFECIFSNNPNVFWCSKLYKIESPFNANRFNVDWTSFIINRRHLIKVKDND